MWLLRDPEPPNRLTAPAEAAGMARLRASWIVGLLVLCLLPRVLMARKVHYICPDGVLYVGLAQRLEAGDLKAALEDFHLNTFPLVLAGLHRLGFGWETAGKVWGVLMGTLAVLPLLGWARRQFGDRWAIAAAVLYAVHPKFIEWSPEMVRDSTFWVVWTTSIYCLWRAVTEVRLQWFMAAGLAMIGAVLTRFEGLFLVLPLLAWAGLRYRHAGERRRRLVLGTVVALSMGPLLLLLASVAWFHGTAGWDLVRWEPLELVSSWGRSLGGSNAATVTAGAVERADPTLAHRLLIMLDTWQRGVNPLIALFTLVGLVAGSRVALRRDYLPLLAVCVVVTAGIWVHLSVAHVSSSRYWLGIVLLTLPFAAGGAISVAEWIAQRHPVALTELSPGVVWVVVLLALFGTIGCADALSSREETRQHRAGLGRWVRSRYGTSAAIVGSPHLGPLVRYYSQGNYYPIPAECDARLLRAMISEHDASVVLLFRRTTSPSFLRIAVEQCENMGLSPVDELELPVRREEVVVLARRAEEENLARSAARAARK